MSIDYSHTGRMKATNIRHTGTSRRTAVLVAAIALAAPWSPARRGNVVSQTSATDTVRIGNTPTLSFYAISNSDNRTRIFATLRCSGTPFTVYKAEWVNCEDTIEPTEPFTLIARPEAKAVRDDVWNVAIDFPFKYKFDSTDVLTLTTDKGVLRCRTSYEGLARERMDAMKTDFEQKIDSSERKSHTAWAILGTVLCALTAGGAAAFIAVRRRFIRKRQEIEQLSMMIAERADSNLDLKRKVDALYGSRLDTLNMLCNEYFDRNDSDRLRMKLYDEVEKHILSLRDAKSIASLEEIVDTYLDGILSRVREQIPSLSKNDLTFLTYLYAGFSPRAVCIFTDIKIKNFYNRRSRLKERILASGAADADFFVSKM